MRCLGSFLLLGTFCATSVAAQPPAGFGGRGGGPVSGVQEDRPLVKQFDTNGDKRLDAAEREIARSWLASERANGPTGGREGRRPRGPRPGGGAPRGAPRGVVGTPGVQVSADTIAPVPASRALYDTGVLRTVFLEFENADWEKELEDFHGSDVEVPALVTVDGERYPDVGVHFRGMSSYMMIAAGSKRSLNLSFDFVHDEQSLLGYRTLNLLNANGDPTFLRTVLFSHIANQYMPAPRANFVRVVINGELWGVYVNVQQYNKDFLRDFYKTETGGRWKVPGSPNARGGLEYLGDDAAPYKKLFEIKGKDDPKRWTDLVNLTRVLNETPLGELETALEPILNVDSTLRFLAIDAALANSDGYWTRASDYSIYKDSTGRFHVLPHDMNEALLEEGGRGRGPSSGPELDPLTGLADPTKPLRSRLLAVPSLRARYLGYVREIADQWLDWNTLNPLVTQWQSLIAEDVALDTRKLFSTEAFATGTRGTDESLQSFVEKRREYLLRTVSGKPE